MKIKSAEENLKTILSNAGKRITISNPYNDLYIPIIEIIRTLDYHTFLLSHEKDKKSRELLGLYKFGWSYAFSLFFENFEISDDIPLFALPQIEREWIDSITQHCGSIQLCRQFLSYKKADLFDLIQKTNNSFVFSSLIESNEFEIYDRQSLGYYHSIMNEVLKKKSELIFSKLPKIRKKLNSIVKVFQEQFIQYKATEEIDIFYHDFGYFYLMTTQTIDDFAEDDSFGGIKYKDYLIAVELTISAGLMHRDCCTAICNKTNYKINLRDILTYAFNSEKMFLLISEYLKWDIERVKTVFSCLLVTKENYIHHLNYPGAPCAPYFQLREGTWMRSTFGCLEMPVFFLNRELKRKYNFDYYIAVNRREERFRNQLYELLKHNQIVSVNENVIIKEGRRVITDIDAVLFDKKNCILALFQLKWQDPYSTSMSERFSKISNLIPKSVEWIDKIQDWISKNDSQTILKTCKLGYNEIRNIHLFVIARHHMNFTKQSLDHRANWASWYQLLEATAKIKDTQENNAISRLAEKLNFFSPKE